MFNVLRFAFSVQRFALYRIRNIRTIKRHIMAAWKQFEEIEAWQHARNLCHSVFLIFEKETANKDYALKNQMSRSSGSIMDNIAEGFERNGNKEFIQFLSISKASCGELKSQLYRCLDREYLSENEFLKLKDETDAIRFKIGGLIRYLKNSSLKGSKYR